LATTEMQTESVTFALAAGTSMIVAIPGVIQP
jgi:hypothetical protein